MALREDTQNPPKGKPRDIVKALRDHAEYPYTSEHGAKVALDAADEIERLREALKPFAGWPIGSEMFIGEDFEETILFSNGGKFITVGDVCRARSNLSINSIDARARSRVSELEEALKPFARDLRQIDAAGISDDCYVSVFVPVLALRRARAVISDHTLASGTNSLVEAEREACAVVADRFPSKAHGSIAVTPTDAARQAADEIAAAIRARSAFRLSREGGENE